MEDQPELLKDEVIELLNEAKNLLKSKKFHDYRANWKTTRIDPPTLDTKESDMEKIKNKLKSEMTTQKKKGWYLFESSDESLLYIGSSKDIRNRFKRHIEKKFQKRNQEWRVKFWIEHSQPGERWNLYWYEAWPSATEEDLLSIEHLLQVVLNPCYQNYKMNKKCICKSEI